MVHNTKIPYRAASGHFDNQKFLVLLKDQLDPNSVLLCKNGVPLDPGSHASQLCEGDVLTVCKKKLYSTLSSVI